MHPVVRKLAAGLLASLSLGIALFTACALWPPFRLGVLYVLGRHSACSFPETISADEMLLEKQRVYNSAKASSRLIETDGKLERWSTPVGDLWSPARTKPVFLAMEQMWGVYDRKGMSVQPGDVVFDCGANVGVFTHRALSLGADLVVAVEPSPENIACLRRTFAEEIASGRVVLKELGVWDETTALRFFQGPNSAVDSFVWEWQGEQQEAALDLPVTTIDALVEELGLERVDYLKLDVEGAEARALMGARRTIERWRPRIAFDAEDDNLKEVYETAQSLDASYRLESGPCEDALHRVRPTTAYLR